MAKNMLSVRIPSTIPTSSLLRTRISEKMSRPEGGIEPLRLSTPTGLKPATRTTECHLDIDIGKIGLSKVTIWSHNLCHENKDDYSVTNGSKFTTFTRGLAMIPHHSARMVGTCRLRWF